MITPRQTRLFRAVDLRAFQRTIRRLAAHPDISQLRNCCVIVPSGAAGDQLRRTIENHHLQSTTSADRAVCLPQILTRSGWYDAMHARMPSPPRRLSDLEREVLMNAAARDVAGSDIGAPFRLRAGLLVEMLALYDDLRRRDASVDSFERVISRDLERDADADRGAERLLRQTRFLAASFRGYEARRDATGAVDEYALRSRLLEVESSRPLKQVIVTVGERSVDPAGLWPADLGLLTQLPYLERIDVVATRATIAAGLLERLDKFMPGFEEAELPPDDATDRDCSATNTKPVLMIPREGQLFSVTRDREDELSSVAEALKSAGGSDLDRRAVVFKRPLPYVYLARDVFADAGIPYQMFDALPLAAEPYAAALDLVFEFVTSNFTREPVVALLASPHFSFRVGTAGLRRSDISTLNRALSDDGYFGGADHLSEFASKGLRAAQAAVAAAGELRALSEKERPSVQLAALAAFLDAHDRIPLVDDPLRERHLRARSAVHSAIHGLRRAHEHLDDSPAPISAVVAMIRRWIEGQTFSPRAGTTGVQLLDAQAARYGEFDEVFLVGLIEGEWPQRSTKNIFYPSSLLRELDWPDSRMALAGERAGFQDLMTLACRQVHLSTFELENDSIIGPSMFLEEADRLGLRTLTREPTQVGRIFVHEALTADPVVTAAVQGEAASWLGLRLGRSEATAGHFHGTAGAYRPAAYSVSSLERYLQCPFRFFSERVLDLREDPEDEATLNSKELGIFVHEVFQKFFEEWNRQGQTGITPGNLAEARATFREVIEPLLATLPEDEAVIQRTRLLGSAADEGLAEAVFQVEAEWETPVVERLLEQALEGEFEISTETETRTIALRGKADRIDLLQDGTFRIIDYKLSRAPDRKLALQLPIYTVCAIQHLRKTTGKEWEAGQAGYIAFGQDRQFVPMLARGKNRDATLLDAQARLLDAVQRIERGEFPPTPADPMMCTRCAYAAVCRKDYVGDV
ncbi:MAG TPA: PD-(D/E)XK nuclease family protein [Vicinamibacterales bacterium]|nr:PD-(D/E)XK nuclease family protein [Vicinamibacterales bacterium]